MLQVVARDERGGLVKSVRRVSIVGCGLHFGAAALLTRLRRAIEDTTLDANSQRRHYHKLQEMATDYRSSELFVRGVYHLNSDTF